jgi:hypothetical protein
MSGSFPAYLFRERHQHPAGSLLAGSARQFALGGAKRHDLGTIFRPP